MTLIFNVRDFGATADDATDDSAAIQAAIDAAFEAGGGTVYVPTGTYLVSGDPNNASAGAVEVRSNVTLTGDGIGNTILRLVDDFDARINGIVRTPAKEDAENVTISNLTIDGNRENNLGFQTGIITGVKESSGRIHTDITISGVEVMNANGYGINPHEITYNLIVENSISHGNGVDGFVADNIIGGIYRNNVAYDNDRHGFNATTSSQNVIFQDGIAYGNGGAGGIVQRGDIFPEGQNDIDWPNGIQFIGGEYYNNGREGIYVKMAENVTISDVDIYGNQFQGIRLDGALNTVVENSRIYNNSQAGDGVYDEIQIRLRADSFTSQTYYSLNTQIIGNEIFATGEINARYGIREEISNTSGGPSGTLLSNNVIYGMDTSDVSVPGYVENPQPEPPPTDFPPIFVGTTQAESLALSVFEIESLSAADGGAAIASRSKGVEATAKGSFVGEDGVYTLSIAYFDENDGASNFGLRINGTTVATWVADQDLGTNAARSSNLVSYEVTVMLAQFDKIEVFAERDGGEFVRIDSISAIPSLEPPPEDDNPVVAVSDSYLALEDEVLFVDAQSGVLANDSAADGGLAAVAGEISTVRGATVVLQADGSFTYTPAADFFGVDEFQYTALDVDGDTAVATVTIDVQDQPEPVVTPHPQLVAGVTQAEVLDLAGFEIERLSAADEGFAISSRTKGVEASAKGSFVGEDGQYLLSVFYFDENDGASTFGVRVNDTLIASWVADQDFGTAGASAGSRVSQEMLVDLNHLDTIELFGTRDGGELVRIDSFVLESDFLLT